MKQKNIIVMVIVVIIVGVGAFFGGMQYQKSQQPSFTQFGGRGQLGGGDQGGNRMFRQRAGGQGGNVQAVRGEITSTDSGSITVKMQDGSSKLVSISKSTNITKSDAGATTDLKKGEQVMVFGSNNSDGSVTAQMVQLNPMMRFGGNTGGKQPAPTQ